MTDEAALLPCPNPWCGSTMLPIPVYGTSGWRIWCGCGVSSHARPTEAEAIATWNTRAPDPEITRQREVIEAWHDIDRKRDAEIERLKAANGILEDALQEVGDDYPGSSCQEWCRQQVKQARAALKEPSHED